MNKYILLYDNNIEKPKKPKKSLPGHSLSILHGLISVLHPLQFSSSPLVSFRLKTCTPSSQVAEQDEGVHSAQTHLTGSSIAGAWSSEYCFKEIK